MDDATLKTQVHDKLIFEPGLRPEAINVSVEKGIVTLSGTVRTFFEKQAAERAAQNVKGIKAVVDELQADLDASLQRSDSDIAEAAIRSLAWDVSVPIDKIKITVEKGVVKLTGDVEYQYQKERAYKDVRSLYGVKDVLNYITIKPTVSFINAQQVSKQIMSEFQRNAVLDAKHITVEVQGTKIILKGKVRSWAELDEAKKAAWSIAGVTDVDEEKLVISYDW